MREEPEHIANNAEEDEELRHNVEAIEERIDKLHREGLADPEGVLFRESTEVPNEWLDLMEYGEETLELDEAGARHLEDLMRMLLRGELQADEHKADLNELLNFMVKFREKRKASPLQ